MESYIEIIEKNHISHFAYLPEKLGFEVTQAHGVTVINCGLKSSMFNIAYGSPKHAQENTLLEIQQHFHGQPAAWWIPPSACNPEFSQLLMKNGWFMETVEHAMICNLDQAFDFSQKTDLQITVVTTLEQLADFLSVLEPYDPYVKDFYRGISPYMLQQREKLVVGYLDAQPVSIGILFLGDQSAGIFSLLTQPSFQGQGYGTDMLQFLLKIAQQNNCYSVTLSASSDSGFRIYQRLGFSKVGEFECFEHKGTLDFV